MALCSWCADGSFDALNRALTAFADEYLPSGIRETPEWQAVLDAAQTSRGGKA